MTPRRTLALAIAACGVLAQAAAQLTPAEAVAAMGRGINLGNTLEPPREGAWNNGPARETYFDAYAEAGFTNVRIPVRWDQHTARTAPYAIDATWMDRVEEVVDWALERDLYVVLNGHHEDWLKRGYADADLRARYDSIWVQVVERFSGKSDRLLYEIINEPFGMTRADVDDLNRRILGIIRATEPTRLVIYGGDRYSNADELLAAAVPDPDDDYLIGYYHAYDPYLFGLEGQGRWGTQAHYRELASKVARVRAWSQRTGIPVHLSEFGAVRRADYNSRMRFYAAYTEAAVEAGFAFSAWDDGGDFRILERGSGEWPEVKDILVHTHADGPTGTLVDLGPDNEGPVRLRWRNRAAATDSIRIERSVNGGAFGAWRTVGSGTEEVTDPDATDGVYAYRLYTRRSADGILLHGYPARIDRRSTGAVVNYADDLSAAGEQFSGNPSGVSFDVSAGVLSIVGDGTSGLYETISYELRDDLGNPIAADVAGSGDKLYLSARTRSGRAAELRVDVVDGDEYASTLAGRTASISGDGFATYVLDFAGGYTDGAYGGTGCRQGGPSCPVNPRDVRRLTFYPEPGVGRFAEAIEVDRLSFGRPLTSGITDAQTLGALAASPNPATDLVTLTFDLAADARVGFTVADALGREVARVTEQPYALGAHRRTFDTSALPAGVYAFALSVDGRPAGTRRVVVR